MKRLDFVLRGDGEPEEVRLEGDADSWRFTRGGTTRAFTVARLPDGRWSLLFADGRQISGRARPSGGAVDVAGSSGALRIQLDDPLHDRLSHIAVARPGSGEEEIRALMPGRVLEVRVSVGDRVDPGTVLLVIEAMKMQNEIRADSSGIVARCAVAPGDAVDGGALLLQLHPPSNL